MHLVLRNKIAVILVLLTFINYAVTFAEGTTFDFSIEPEEVGQTLVFRGTGSWNEGLASSVSFRWYEATERLDSLPDFPVAFQTTRFQNLSLDLYPLVIKTRLKKSNLALSFGGEYLRISEDTKAVIKDSEGLVIAPAGQYFSYTDKRTANIFAPVIGFTVAIPFSTFMNLSYKESACPVYFLSLEQKTRYDFLDKAASNSVERWSTPFFEQRLALDMGRYVRVVAEHRFQRLDFQTMDWNDTGTGLEGVDDIQTIARYRFGGESFLPLAASGPRLKGGVFWEINQNNSSHWGLIDTENRLAFTFGTEY